MGCVRDVVERGLRHEADFVALLCVFDLVEDLLD